MNMTPFKVTFTSDRDSKSFISLESFGILAFLRSLGLTPLKIYHLLRFLLSLPLA
jgi:hypothetical protein